MDVLGRPEVKISGADFALHDRPERYRALIEAIKTDPRELGGLVTTHKIDLVDAAGDLFDELRPHAALLGEISSFYKRGNRLIGDTTDPMAGGASLYGLLGPEYFGRTGAPILCFGAGGAATALALSLLERTSPGDRPAEMVLVDIDPQRAERFQTLFDPLAPTIRFRLLCHREPEDNDRLLASMPAHTVVINATGMGKDRPGSPLSSSARFPEEAVVWELNYRGERLFLQQAQRQAVSGGLTVADGWTYFLRGWSSVIGQVLNEEITPDRFARMAAVAERIR